jgi:histidyl-tRNA synthetase
VAIQGPKGTRDFYPEAQSIQNYIFDKWRQSCLLYAYEEYEGPTFENLELYTGKSGDEIVTQLYNFEDKGGRNIALRPEMTPTLARLVNQKGRNLKKPARWFSIPRLFRYERAQKGRLREFYQLNLDIIGSESIWCEVDLLQAIAHMLKGFGLKDTDFVIGISSRRLLAALLEQLKVENAAPVYAALDKQAKIGDEAFKQLLAEAGLDEDTQEFLSRFMAQKDLTSLVDFCETDESKAALAELNELFILLKKCGLKNCIALDLSIVRGLAYYTGIVFEIFDQGKSMRALAGGGRYDNLCAQLGGESVTGVGFGMGDVVLANLLEEGGLFPKENPYAPHVWMVSFSGEADGFFTTGNKLREASLRTGFTLKDVKFRKQLDAANNSGAKFVLFVDGEKNTENTFEVKNLKTGEQSVLTVEEILKEIKG